MTMTEEKFYEAAELMETASLPSGMGKYYPTVDEINTSIQGRKLEDFIPVLLYFASDPYSSDLADDATYKETVKYAKELTSKMKL